MINYKPLFERIESCARMPVLNTKTGGYKIFSCDVGQNLYEGCESCISTGIKLNLPLNYSAILHVSHECADILPKYWLNNDGGLFIIVHVLDGHYLQFGDIFCEMIIVPNYIDGDTNANAEKLNADDGLIELCSKKIDVDELLANASV